MHRPYRPRDICGPSARHCICEHYVLYKELKICVTLTNALNTSHRRRNGICVTVSIGESASTLAAAARGCGCGSRSVEARTAEGGGGGEGGGRGAAMHGAMRQQR